MRDIDLICPVCSWDFRSGTYKTISYPSGESPRNKPQIICLCENCGLGIAYPMPAPKELNSLYTTGIYWRNSDVKILQPREYPGQYVLAKARWEFIKAFIKCADGRKSISILDIGAGQGFLGMIAALDRDIELKKYVAVEKDSVLKESLLKTWRKSYSNISIQIYDAIDEVDEIFDLVALSHILEHLLNPDDFLRRAVMKVRNNGFIFLEVPSKDYLFKKDVFPHLFFFDSRSIKKLYEKNDINNPLITCYGYHFNQSNLNSNINKKLLSVLSKIMYKIRYIVPMRWILDFFSWHLGVNCKNSEGTWIRAIVQKK